MPALIFMTVIIVLLLFTALLFFLYARRRDSLLPVASGGSDTIAEVGASKSLPCFFTDDLPNSTQFEQGNRKRESLAEQWQFRNDPDDRGLDEQWFKPGSTEAEDAGWDNRAVPSIFNAAGENRSRKGYIWYRKTFKTGSVPEGLWCRLCFDALPVRSSVFMNGQLLAEEEDGLRPVFPVVSDFLNHDKDNVLILRLENPSEWESGPSQIEKDHNSGGNTSEGIFPDVSLETLPINYIINAVAHTAVRKDQVSLTLDVLIKAPDSSCRIEVTLIDPEGRKCGGSLINFDVISGKSVRGGSCSIPLDHPVFWNSEDPVLYTVLIESISTGYSDRLSFKTGLKSIEINNN